MSEPTDAPASAVESSIAPAPTYQWAPPPVARRRRRGLWAGGIAAAVVIGIVTASLVLIAPGTAIAGVPVGGLTVGAAADAVDARLAATRIAITAPGVDAVVTGADLGAHVDAKALAGAAFDSRPMWNPTAWFSGASEAAVSLDTEAAAATLRKAAPSLFTDPVDAAVHYDATTHSYVVTPATPGTGIDLDAVSAAVHTAFAAGRTSVALAVAAVPVEANTPTWVANGGARVLNRMISTAGFYVGKERTVPIAADQLAAWLTVSTNERGAMVITADAAGIQTAVDALTAKVDRVGKDGAIVTNAAGKKLKTLSAGLSARTVHSTAGIAAGFATQLAAGNAVYALPVTEHKPTIVTLARRVEVDLTKQRAYFYENDTLVRSYLVATGKPGFETGVGHFRIFAKVRIQDMGCFSGVDYCSKDVPWVSYFNGDEALHGAGYLPMSAFGRVHSHGCVNMPVDAAKFAYEWAPVGTEVWTHY